MTVKIIDIHPNDDWYDKYYNLLVGLCGDLKYTNRYWDGDKDDFYSCVFHLKKDLRYPIGGDRHYNNIPFRGIKFVELDENA